MVAAPILLTIVLAFFVFGLVSTQHSQTVLALATAESARLAGDRAHTAVSVRAAWAIQSDLTLEVLSTGGVSIADFERMDLFVDYTGIVQRGTWPTPTTTERVAVRLQYTSGVPVAGEWRVAGLAPDLLHPGIWNPGETLTIEAVLPRAGLEGTLGSAVLSTPNGVTASGYFTISL
jgi:hypothetical protein